MFRMIWNPLFFYSNSLIRLKSVITLHTYLMYGDREQLMSSSQRYATNKQGRKKNIEVEEKIGDLTKKYTIRYHFNGEEEINRQHNEKGGKLGI